MSGKKSQNSGTKIPKGLVVVSDTPIEEETISAWFWVLFGLTILILVILIIILINPIWLRNIDIRGMRFWKVCT